MVRLKLKINLHSTILVVLLNEIITPVGKISRTLLIVFVIFLKKYKKEEIRHIIHKKSGFAFICKIKL